MRPRLCGICLGDPGRRKLIDRQLASGTSPNRIEALAKEAGYPVKRETIAKHHKSCLGAGERPPEEVALAAKASATGSSTDFAQLVKAEAVRRLEAGELRVRVGDGLAAQALLDRRAEKQKDRELASQIGKLLAGMNSEDQRVISPPILIEDGEYSEIGEYAERPMLGSGD